VSYCIDVPIVVLAVCGRRERAARLPSKKSPRHTRRECFQPWLDFSGTPDLQSLRDADWLRRRRRFGATRCFARQLLEQVRGGGPKAELRLRTASVGSAINPDRVDVWADYDSRRWASWLRLWGAHPRALVPLVARCVAGR